MPRTPKRRDTWVVSVLRYRRYCRHRDLRQGKGCLRQKTFSCCSVSATRSGFALPPYPLTGASRPQFGSGVDRRGPQGLCSSGPGPVWPQGVRLGALLRFELRATSFRRSEGSFPYPHTRLPGSQARQKGLSPGFLRGPLGSPHTDKTTA